MAVRLNKYISKHSSCFILFFLVVVVFIVVIIYTQAS